jgi:cell division protein ZapE
LPTPPTKNPRCTSKQREIRACAAPAAIIWFDFATLCGGPRSQNDYLEMASRFHTVILSGFRACRPPCRRKRAASPG